MECPGKMISYLWEWTLSVLTILWETRTHQARRWQIRVSGVGTLVLHCSINLMVQIYIDISRTVLRTGVDNISRLVKHLARRQVTYISGFLRPETKFDACQSKGGKRIYVDTVC